ncbi:MAG: glycosyltransferase [Vicinamibacterales bacterium]
MISVGFLRPRMGIGGAERLVTDAAVCLKQRGRDVTLFVPDRMTVAQFPELAAHKIPFERAGQFMPSHIAGRMRAPLSIARTAYAGWRMSHSARRPDVIFSDVVPHAVPLVKRLTGRPVLYYCNYPDLLLTPEGSRTSAGYRTYRKPLDRFEADGIAAADVVVTNSRFTSRVITATFPAIPPSKLQVLYPGVRVPDGVAPRTSTDDEIVFLSVNRFDPRKNLALAVDTVSSLAALIPTETFARVRVILAGYYDRRLPEAVALVEELQRRAAAAGVQDRVTFAFSPSEAERQALMRRCRAVIYTPTAEHFGLVPLEAMAAGRPVVAVNNGGPTETVVHGTTGFLCEPSPDAFAAAMATLVNDPDAADAMGRAGHHHVATHFSLDAFGNALDRLIVGLAQDATHAS